MGSGNVPAYGKKPSDGQPREPNRCSGADLSRISVRIHADGGREWCAQRPPGTFSTGWGVTGAARPDFPLDSVGCRGPCGEVLGLSEPLFATRRDYPPPSRLLVGESRTGDAMTNMAPSTIDAALAAYPEPVMDFGRCRRRFRGIRRGFRLNERRWHRARPHARRAETIRFGQRRSGLCFIGIFPLIPSQKLTTRSNRDGEQIDRSLPPVAMDASVHPPMPHFPSPLSGLVRVSHRKGTAQSTLRSRPW
jgi:hypothetical protein